MARKRFRDLTYRQQLAGGPVDLPFLMLVLLLTGIGVITVFSASFASAYYESGDPATYFRSQLILAVGGVIVMFLVSRVDYQYLRRLAKWGLVLSAVLLVLVKVPGIGITRNGANRWIRLLGFQFQPSEIAKVGVILYFSAKLADRRPEKKRVRWNPKMTLGKFLNFLDRIGFMELLPYLGVLLLMTVLLLLEPHMSGAILVLAGGAAVLFAGGIHWGWFVAGGGLVGAALGFIMTQTDYMARRLSTFIDPWSDPQNAGWQTIQSLYAIGSGGLLGKGFGQSIQKYLYLPEEHNDFIFSIWCEEMGFIGALVVIVLFVLLILRGYWLALHARDKFGALLIVGIITLTAVQVFLNIGVVTNFIPPTGISLPFFSYGGTALIIQLGEMGIILSVSRQIEAPRLG